MITFEDLTAIKEASLEVGQIVQVKKPSYTIGKVEASGEGISTTNGNVWIPNLGIQEATYDRKMTLLDVGQTVSGWSKDSSNIWVPGVKTTAFYNGEIWLPDEEDSHNGEPITGYTILGNSLTINTASGDISYVRAGAALVTGDNLISVDPAEAKENLGIGLVQNFSMEDGLVNSELRYASNTALNNVKEALESILTSEKSLTETHLSTEESGAKTDLTNLVSMTESQAIADGLTYLQSEIGKIETNVSNHIDSTESSVAALINSYVSGVESTAKTEGVSAAKALLAENGFSDGSIQYLPADTAISSLNSGRYFVKSTDSYDLPPKGNTIYGRGALLVIRGSSSSRFGALLVRDTNMFIGSGHGSSVKWSRVAGKAKTSYSLNAYAIPLSAFGLSEIEEGEYKAFMEDVNGDRHLLTLEVADSSMSAQGKRNAFIPGDPISSGYRSYSLDYLAHPNWPSLYVSTISSYSVVNYNVNTSGSTTQHPLITSVYFEAAAR